MSKLVLVAGPGRSGTSTLTGVLSNLGLHVPQPEIRVNKTNPRGFFEPAWVVAFHKRLLKRVAVPTYDARPEAFNRTARIGARADIQAELQTWLAGQLAQHPDLVVKDPRDTWFLPMWGDAAGSLGCDIGVVMTMRHPAEVVGSLETHYKSSAGRRYSSAHRTANWINMTLATELSTREWRRCFVRYADMIADWRTSVDRIGTSLDLGFRAGVSPESAAAIDGFIDPNLRRVRATWEHVDAPRRLIDLAEAVWQEMSRLVDDPAGQDFAALDALRDEYQDLYDESAAIALSSSRAAAASASRAGRRRSPRKGQPSSGGRARGAASRESGGRTDARAHGSGASRSASRSLARATGLVRSVTRRGR